MELYLDRAIPVSLTEQIKGQITYAIAYGQLNRGDPLPSVRELATTLQVAPMTVTRVYQDLARQGLIATRAGVGTFVADMACLDASERVQASQHNLRQIIDNCMRQATLLGHTLEQVQAEFLASVNEHRSCGNWRHVLIVGNFAPATQYYAQEVESILRDLSAGTPGKQVKRIRAMVKEMDVLVYASGSERVLKWLPSSVEAIEFRHTPEADSVNRLRFLIE